MHYLSTACDTAQLTQLTNFANNGGVSTTQRGALAKALGQRWNATARRSSPTPTSPSPPSTTCQALPPRRRPTRCTPTISTRPVTYLAAVHPDHSGQLDPRPRWSAASRSRCRQHGLRAVPLPSRQRRDAGDSADLHLALPRAVAYASAALSGLCEAIERDAFTITWQAMLSRPRLRVDDLVQSGPAAAVCRCRPMVELMDITTDIVGLGAHQWRSATARARRQWR